MGLCVGKKARKSRRIQNDNSEDSDDFQLDHVKDFKDFNQNEWEDSKVIQESNSEKQKVVSEESEVLKQVNSRDNEVILRHYDFLVDRMSPEFGLIDKLYCNCTLSNFEKEEIEAEPHILKRNKILLDFVIRKNACEDLFEELKMCGQSHLVNYVKEDGVYKPYFGGNWPLADKESSILLKNYETLIDILDSRDLARPLYQTGVLNRRQRNLVSSKTTTEEQNKVLMGILRKGSFDFYWQTIRCLHASNQSHIARILESGGVVVRIDAQLRPSFSNQREVENSLVTKITNLLPSIPDAILEETYLNLLAVAAKHSISFYFLCLKLADVDRLKRMASNGRLKKFVEDLFNRLMDFTTRILVALKWPILLFSKSRNSMEAIQIKNSIDGLTKTMIECLPLETLDTILQSVYIWLSMCSGALNGVKDSDIITFVSSVDTLWFQRILQQRAKRRIWPLLERIVRREFEMYFSFRGCLRYLEEAIHANEVRFMRRDLLAADFYTDLQLARQLRTTMRRYKQGKRSVMLTHLMDEIVNVRRKFKEENKYANFIRFLRQTKQAKEARVLEQNGITAKVEIRRRKNSETDDWSREFSRRLNNLKDRNQLKSDELKKIIENLEDSGLEILNSFVDRGVSVWIWCKSQNAVENLVALYKSQTLIDHLYRLANETNRNSSTKDIHLDDFCQLKIETVPVQNRVINVEGKIEMDKNFRCAIGVTKLRNRIFVLGCYMPYHPYVFYVYDDQHPFRRQRKMTFEGIKYATDISSFEKNFCLYIADSEAKCIWKIRLPEEDKMEDGDFTCTALKSPELSSIGYFTMTITDEGHILIFDNTNPILLFYESESDLNRPTRIDLPKAIYRPEQVAENSAGNFIFLHRTRDKYSSDDENQWVFSEVGRNGKAIIRQHSGTEEQWLDPDGKIFFLVDSKDRIFLADTNNHRLILLDSRLRYAGSLTLGIDEEDTKEKQLRYSWKMFCDGKQKQLIVSGRRKVMVYSLSGLLA